jgi:hypothetical protein
MNYKTITLTVIEGKVAKNIHGSWEDCDPGLYLGDERVISRFSDYLGKHIRVTIEVLDTPTDA